MTIPLLVLLSSLGADSWKGQIIVENEPQPLRVSVVPLRLPISSGRCSTRGISLRDPGCLDPDSTNRVLRAALEFKRPRPLRELTTAEDGSFVVTGVPHGEYGLLVRNDDHAWFVHVIASGQSLDIALERRAERPIEGLVRELRRWPADDLPTLIGLDVPVVSQQVSAVTAHDLPYGNYTLISKSGKRVASLRSFPVIEEQPEVTEPSTAVRMITPGGVVVPPYACESEGAMRFGEAPSTMLVRGPTLRCHAEIGPWVSASAGRGLVSLRLPSATLLSIEPEGRKVVVDDLVDDRGRPAWKPTWVSPGPLVVQSCVPDGPCSTALHRIVGSRQTVVLPETPLVEWQVSAPPRSRVVMKGGQGGEVVSLTSAPDGGAPVKTSQGWFFAMSAGQGAWCFAGAPCRLAPLAGPLPHPRKPEPRVFVSTKRLGLWDLPADGRKTPPTGVTRLVFPTLGATENQVTVYVGRHVDDLEHQSLPISFVAISQDFTVASTEPLPVGPATAVMYRPGSDFPALSWHFDVTDAGVQLVYPPPNATVVY